MTTDTIIPALPFAALGLVLGLAFFGLLRFNLSLYLERRAPWLGAALHLARLAGLGLALWVVAGHGAAPLLLALAGFLAARALMVRRGEEAT